MKLRKLRNQSGATFIEYALLAGLVAIVVAVAAVFFGDELKGLFSATGEQTHNVTEGVKKADLKANVDKVAPGQK
ncbi:MAG: Flp family type IVb pilin [Kiritimatiellia bacterium]